MGNHRPVDYLHFASLPLVPFDVDSLESETVTRLFQEVKSYLSDIQIEMIAGGNSSRGQEERAAATIGVTIGHPTVLFFDCLSREQRIEAIGHELGHLLLLYQFGLGLLGLRMPPRENGEEAIRSCTKTKESRHYLLGQIPNTIHHLILVGYLKKEYGITSTRHVRFLQRYLQKNGGESSEDRDLLYARGLVAFEYEALIGQVNRVIALNSQSEYFRMAYRSAQEYFGAYSSSSIPTPRGYEQDILSLLETLGYRKEDFLFFPGSGAGTGTLSA